MADSRTSNRWIRQTYVGEDLAPCSILGVGNRGTNETLTGNSSAVPAGIAFVASCKDRGKFGETSVADDINVLALVKGKERYVFLYDDSNRSNALRTLVRFASKSDLSFSWYDAAVLSQRVRQQGQSNAVPEPHSDRHRFREKLEN